MKSRYIFVFMIFGVLSQHFNVLHAKDTIPAPWSNIRLTGEKMKPGYPFLIPDSKKSFPWLPVIGGTAAGSVLAAVLLIKDDKPVNCSFLVTALPVAASCGLANGAANVTVNPPGEYDYQWSNGTTSSTLSNVASGHYQLTVTQRGTKCIQIVDFTIPNESFAFTVQTITTDAECGKQNGIATISATPSSLNYSYQWSNGSSGPTLSNITAGIYQFTVSAGGNCTQTGSVAIGEEAAKFDASFAIKPASCGQNNGSITVSVNPAGNYEFIWSNGMTGSSLDQLAKGNYQVTITQTGTHCKKEFTATIDESPVDYTVSYSSKPATCKDANGSATLIIDPPGEYDIYWSNNQTGISIQNLLAGEYKAEVARKNSTCKISITVIIEEAPPPFSVLSIKSTAANCNASDGIAEVEMNPAGNYEYHWSHGATGNPVNGLKSGTYSVTVTTPGSTCAVTGEINVNVQPAGFTITAKSTSATCGIADGSAALSIDPPGNYIIQWSNGYTASTNEKLSAGEYTVTVTNEKSCKLDLKVVVEENPANYISDFQSLPGNCIGKNGDIILELQSPSTGPFFIEARGPGNNYQIRSAVLTAKLSSFFPVIPGLWKIAVRDSSLRSTCVQQIEIHVKDSSDFYAKDDTLVTKMNQLLSGNVFLNDTGTSIKIISNTFPQAGVLNLMTDGKFTYNPPKDSAGTFTFLYTVQDTCRDTLTRSVTIRIDSIRCNFTVKFTNTPAHCGFADGSIKVSVDSAGTYVYKWNTGATTSDISKVSKGNYTVTITDTSKKCDLEFTTSLDELPPSYHRNLVVTQPRCPTKGEIRFEVISPGSGPMKMIVEHPNGSTVFTVPKGTLSLSSLINIVNGDYSISLYDESAGIDCLDEFMVSINGTTDIEIMVESVIPPSSPSGMDGSILIVVTIPGTRPYTILLNGLPVMTANSDFFEIGGLAAGDYMVQIRDRNGCLSNKLNVTVPVRLLILTTGLSVNRNSVYQKSRNEITTNTKSFTWFPTVQLQLVYPFLGLQHESGMDAGFSNHRSLSLQFHQFLKLKDYEWNKIHASLLGGLSFDLHGSEEIRIDWNFSLRLDYPAGETLMIYTAASCKIWNEIDAINYQMGIKLKILDRYREKLNSLSSIPIGIANPF